MAIAENDLKNINDDIDSLLDLYRYPPDRLPPGYKSKDHYRSMIGDKINRLMASKNKINKPYTEDVSFDEMVEMAGDLDRDTFGLIESIKIAGINGELSALIDSGNGAYNVLHGIDVEDIGHQISFTTVGDQRLTMDKHEDVFIHVGSGNKETRPVIDLTIEIAGKVYPDVMFSVADRSENQHPVLIGADFLSQIDAIIDVNK
jgi:hypothetical protein